MDTVVYGVMRSGTTLVCDLLTVPERSLIFNEPMILEGWPDAKVKEMHAVAKAFGLGVEDQPPTRETYGSFAGYFEQAMGAELAALDNWGVKEVHFNYWRALLDQYQPDRLVICVRDLRDIALSALDLVRGSLLAFPGGQRLRDEAWLVARLRHDVREILALRQRPHFLASYEDLTQRLETQDDLAAYVGLTALGSGTVNRKTAAGASRQRELDKHGAAISSRSVGRHGTEDAGPALALANYIWQALPEYSQAFGYPIPEASKQEMSDETPIPWQAVQDWRWPGPDGFDPAFARRRARSVAARNIGEGTFVLGVGCTLPVLKFMLPPGCSYLGVDTVARPPMVAAAIWMVGDLPDAPDADLITVLGSLEHVADVPRFLNAVKDRNTPMLLTYHASNDTQGLDRMRFGWQNHFSRDDLEGLFSEVGFQVNSLWAFDGHQSLFRLRP
ncbi:MAG: hypothetical protein GKS02_08850 [Alphaproteobacteria bacterium]|nr:hypothetical protein [Alphaproteobacteria bacterium]